jgi:hypothetical protein
MEPYFGYLIIDSQKDVHCDSVALSVHETVDESSHSVVPLSVRHYDATDIPTLIVDDLKSPDLSILVRIQRLEIINPIEELEVFLPGYGLPVQQPI